MLSNKGTINEFEVLDLKYENEVLFYRVDSTLNNTIYQVSEFWFIKNSFVWWSGLTVLWDFVHQLHKKGILWFLIKKKTSKGTKIYFSYGEAIGLKLKKDNVVINALNKTLIRSE